MPAERPRSPAAFLGPDASDDEIDVFVAILALPARTGAGTLFTLGYSGLRGADDLRRLITGTGIDTIVDVRLSAWSSSYAFSVGGTRRTVEAAGFAYVHLPDLGNLRYRTTGIQIKNIEAIEDVLALLRAGHSVALLCICQRADGCHRQVLAEEAVRRMPGLKVVHL